MQLGEAPHAYKVSNKGASKHHFEKFFPASISQIFGMRAPLKSFDCVGWMAPPRLDFSDVRETRIARQ